MIEHLVLSGGLEIGLVQAGVLEAMEAAGTIEMSAMRTIHATSVGAVLAVMVACRMSASDISTYLVSRPIHRDFQVACDAPRDHPQKGLVSGVFFRSILSNVLHSVNLDPDATLADLAVVADVDVHMFSVRLDGMGLVDLSAATHPALPVWRAVHMSAALPGIFEPAYWEDAVYVDGGVRRNYPLPECLAHPLVEPAAVLGLSAATYDSMRAPPNPNESAMGYVQTWFSNILAALSPKFDSPEAVTTVDLPPPPSLGERLPRLVSVLESSIERRRLVERGKNVVLQ
jgi:predicted acylesterase/phospholipase RssA